VISILERKGPDFQISWFPDKTLCHQSGRTPSSELIGLMTAGPECSRANATRGPCSARLRQVRCDTSCKSEWQRPELSRLQRSSQASAVATPDYWGSWRIVCDRVPSLGMAPMCGARTYPQLGLRWLGSPTGRDPRAGFVGPATVRQAALGNDFGSLGG